MYLIVAVFQILNQLLKRKNSNQSRIVDPTSIGEGNETLVIRVYGNLSLVDVDTFFKIMRPMTICNRPNRIIFASGMFMLLRMVLEPDIGC